MDFYKIIKSIVNRELKISPLQDINTDKFFNKDISKNIFANNATQNDEYIISRKRKRDFYNDQKKNSESNSEINCAEKQNINDKTTLLYIVELYRNNKSYQDIVIDKTLLKNYVINNDFLKQSQKDTFLTIYCRAVKYLKRLNFFARCCKQRKAIDFEVDCDLFLNDFDDLSDNILTRIYIQRTNTFYRFRISDLIGIVENALTHSPDIFIESYFPRNPYTNCEFTKAELYNIYFSVKESSFIMSQLFHNFFLMNFDLKEFATMNDDLLRDIAITNYGHHMCDQELMAEFENMEDNCKKYMPRISAGFNRLQVAKELKPQVILFLRYSYSNSKIKRFYYFGKLKKQLEKIKRERRFFIKKNYFTRKIKPRKPKINQSQIVNGIFTFGHNPENEVLESESSVTTDTSNDNSDENDNENTGTVEPYYPESLPELEAVTPPTTPPSSSSNSEQHVMPSFTEIIDQFVNENQVATEQDIDLDNVEMEDQEEEIMDQEAIERLENFRRLAAETDSSSDSSSSSDESDGIRVTV